MGAVACGAVLGWTANIEKNQEKNIEFNNITIGDSEIGWIGSFATLGALLSCIPIAIFCDFVGRKLAMLLLVIPFMLGWLLIIFATSVEMIYAGRFITGFSGGAFCVSAPLYTSEIAETPIRGALGSYFQLLLTVGILLAYFIAYFTSVIPYTIICAIFPLIFGFAFFFQPETPVYNLKKGNETAAREALRKLRGDYYDIESEIKEIKHLLAETERTKVSFIESFKTIQAKKASMIVFGLMFFQQLSGINAVIFYTSEIFDSAGSSLQPQIATIIIGVLQVIATFVSSLIIDKFGRRILLLGSDIFMVISGAILGLFFSLKERELIDKETVETLGFIPILALSVFIIVFSLGYGPIPWMIASEISPTETKSALSSAAGTFNWFLAFIVTKFYGDIKTATGGDVTFYIFSVISVLGTLFVIIFVPETKGKSLEQIQKELSGNKTNAEGIENAAYQ